MNIFETFCNEINSVSPPVEYVWSSDKSHSCDWMISRIAPGAVGLDVGGTEWLCDRLVEKGCDVTYYDWVPPKNYKKFVADDMMNVMAHFPEKSFDFITTRHTLEHALCPMFQLWCYNKLLKDNGKLLVIVPQHSREWVWFQTHHSALPRENWLMLFYRMGFKIKSSDAGTWNPTDSKFIEYRFELELETRTPRMTYSPTWLPF